LAAIESLSVQHSQDLDVGEGGSALGSEALGVQLLGDLLEGGALGSEGEDAPDGLGFLFDHLERAAAALAQETPEPR